MNPVVYMSAELKARDLDSRLLIAVEAIQRGLHVVFGQQWAISKNFHSMPEGAVLFKTVNEIQAAQMFDASESGHIIAATDEEVLACACQACFQSGMGPTAAQLLDIFFAQGNQHASIVGKQYPILKERIRITGNPRIDLLGKWGRRAYQSQAKAIKAQVGRYILFNTNFGWINSIWNAREDTKQIAVRTGHLDLNDPLSVSTYESELEWERSNMIELEHVIDWMEKGLPGFKAVIRPHPAEDVGYWKTKYRNREHVMIVDGASHIPWTIGADALVHTTCSTGMEATIMNIPALSITPKSDAALHSYLLTNSVNPTVPTWREATQALSDYLFTAKGPLADRSQYSSELQQYFPDVDGSQSAAKIAQELLSLIQQRSGPVRTAYNWDLRQGLGWTQVNRRSEWKEKFTVESDELASRLQKMAKLISSNKTISIQKLDDSLFLLFGT